jgi:DNA-binding transcriptional LysR family regulator
MPWPCCCTALRFPVTNPTTYPYGVENLLKKLDLTSLRLFVAVCQEKNIARAAEREFIASSAVSRRIAEIEALIGLPVIERRSRGVIVTPVGETVLRHALTIIGDIEKMSAELSRYVSGAKGRVRMVANLSSIVQFLPEDIAAFERLFPHVQIDLAEHDTADVVRLVGEHGADLGICNDTGLQGADLEHAAYRVDRLVLAVPLSHRLAHAAQARFAELLDERFVNLHTESALTRHLEKEAAKSQATLQVKITVSSLDALCRMVHVGLGVAIVPELTARLYLGSLDIALIPLTDPWATRQLVIVHRPRTQLSASAAALLHFLTQQAS